MTTERWQEIKAQIRADFELIEEYQEDLDPGVAEVVEFNGPSAKMKLKYVTRPKLLEKRTGYSNRIGSNVNVDYIYSTSETTSHLEAWQWSEGRGDWEKFSAQALF